MTASPTTDTADGLAQLEANACAREDLVIAGKSRQWLERRRLVLERATTLPLSRVAAARLRGQIQAVRQAIERSEPR